MSLSVPQGDGAPLRAHLQSAYRATGVLDPRLESALRDLPSIVRPIWQTYEALSDTRHDGAPITHLEIEAWQRLHGIVLTPWEVDTLLDMDRAALSAVPRKAP